LYAIIKTGGKQYRVKKGDIIKVEKIKKNPGELVEVNDVLAVRKDDEFKTGNPFVEGAKVVLRVIEEGKGPKVIVFKYKPKKNYRRKQGHRQPYTKVKVEEIEA